MTRRWLLGCLIATATVWLLQATPLWRQLHISLLSLDFDVERAWLIEAWLAAGLLACLATLLVGHPWRSAALGTLYVAATYGFPLSQRVIHENLALFGIKEQFDGLVLLRNEVVVLTVAYLAAIVAAATADLIRRTRLPLGFQAAVPAFRVAVPAGVGALALLAAVGLGGSLDPVLRYGPDIAVYRPAPLPVRHSVHGIAAVAATLPQATAVPIPSTGQVVMRTYHSEAMGEDRQFFIYLPRTYEVPGFRRHRYPVVYLLHGDPGGPHDWIALGAPALVDAGITRGVLPESILVFPDGNGHVTYSTQWANRFDGRDRVEDAALELVGVIDRDYRTIRDRQHRVIGGLSSGGFGAANIAARHPDIFAAAMTFSGYFEARGPVFGRDSAYWRANSPYDLVADRPPARTVRYLMVAGRSDEFLASNRRFASQLDRLGVGHELLTISGSHGGAVWIGGLELALTRLADELTPSVGWAGTQF